MFTKHWCLHTCNSGLILNVFDVVPWVVFLLDSVLMVRRAILSFVPSRKLSVGTIVLRDQWPPFMTSSDCRYCLLVHSLNKHRGYARGLRRGRDDNSSNKTRNTSSSFLLITRSQGVRWGCYRVSWRGIRPAFQPSLKWFRISTSRGAGGAPWARAVRWKARLVFPPRVAVQECRSDRTCCVPLPD